MSSDPDNPEDYLVFGWWAQFPDQRPPLSFKGSVRYALIDGPELDHGIVPELSVDGTATYVGPAGGGSTHTRPGATGEKMKANS